MLPSISSIHNHAILELDILPNVIFFTNASPPDDLRNHYVLSSSHPLPPALPERRAEEERRVYELTSQARHEVWQGHPWLQAGPEEPANRQVEDGPDRVELPPPS